jgi:hypothetical protein
MPLSDSPAPAENIITFSGNRGTASELNYNVPLPGRVRGRRILRIEGLPIRPDDWKDNAQPRAIDFKTQIGLTEDGDHFKFDEAKATAFFLDYARASGIRGDIVGAFERQLALSKVEGAGVNREVRLREPSGEPSGTPGGIPGSVPRIPEPLIRTNQHRSVAQPSDGGDP